MIELQNIYKSYGHVLAVNNVNFSVKSGEVLGFLGPNGAGKTTTIKMIAGYFMPTKGKVLIAGMDAFQNSLEAKKRIGYLPEGAPAYEDMTPQSYLSFIADIRNIHGIKKAERIEYAVEQTCLTDVFYQPIETLSKGYKRRLGLAQAILHDPDILLLDEPTDGLDPNQKFEVRSLIQKLSKTKAILVSTHILEEVEAVCNRALIINKGQIIADGTPDSLLKQSPLYNKVIILFDSQKLSQTTVKKIIAELMELEEISEVAFDKQSNELHIYPNKSEKIVSKLKTVAKCKAWPISKIYINTPRLDDTFRYLTTQNS